MPEPGEWTFAQVMAERNARNAEIAGLEAEVERLRSSGGLILNIFDKWIEEHAGACLLESETDEIGAAIDAILKGEGA